jgi:hypothetical protein
MISRKIFSLVLLLATPALGVVTITCSDEGSGIVAIYYDASSESEGVRAFALDVSCDSNCTTIEDIMDYSEGEGAKYGIFPGTIDLADPNNPTWGTPVAPSDDPSAEGTGLGTSRVILEMGTLYETTAPATSGLLCRLQIAEFVGSCHISITVEPTRGGVVLEDGNSVGIVSDGCEFGLSCWNYPTQCHGDADGDCDVDIVDWPYFRDGFGHVPPDPNYEPCGDYDHDEDIDIVDWPQFRDNFGKTCATGLAQDCP